MAEPPSNGQPGLSRGPTVATLRGSTFSRASCEVSTEDAHVCEDVPDVPLSPKLSSGWYSPGVGRSGSSLATSNNRTGELKLSARAGRTSTFLDKAKTFGSLSSFSNRSNNGFDGTDPERIQHLLNKEAARALGGSRDQEVEEALPKHWLLDSRLWVVFVNGLIIVNSLQLGVCTKTQRYYWFSSDDLDSQCKLADQGFLGFFTLEAVLRGIVYRLHYFQSGWHWLDMFVLVVGYGELAVKTHIGHNLASFRTLRVLRVFRLLRLLRLFKDLWVIIEGLLSALRPVVWIGVLLIVELYIFSLVCVDTIGTADSNTYPGFSIEEEHIQSTPAIANFNNFQYFGTIPRSMYTLFNVVIGAEWPEIGRPIWEMQPGFCLLFAVFIICTMFGLMNVLIGVIVDNTKSAQDRLEKEDVKSNQNRKVKYLVQLCEFVFSLDSNKDGLVTLQDMKNGGQTRDVQPLLSMMDLPHGFSAEELFHLFNINGGDDISDDEFVTQAYRLIYGSQFHHQFSTLCSLNEIKAEVGRMSKRQDVWFKGMEDRQRSMETQQRFLHNDLEALRREVRSSRRDMADQDEAIRASTSTMRSSIRASPRRSSARIIHYGQDNDNEEGLQDTPPSSNRRTSRSTEQEATRVVKILSDRSDGPREGAESRSAEHRSVKIRADRSDNSSWETRPLSSTGTGLARSCTTKSGLLEVPDISPKEAARSNPRARLAKAMTLPSLRSAANACRTQPQSPASPPPKERNVSLNVAVPDEEPPLLLSEDEDSTGGTYSRERPGRERPMLPNMLDEADPHEGRVRSETFLHSRRTSVTVR